MIKIIPLAIPVFFMLIGVELLVARAQGRRDYLRFNDAITALNCGIGNQVVKVFTGGLLLAVYWGIYELAAPLHQAIVPWDTWSIWAFLVAGVLFDHQYYWWHRHSHRVNFMWAAHVVHHQSQEYNLAVALRQAMFTNITSLPYYIPLAIIGIHPAVFGLTAAINTLYQFWIHTRTVGKLGPLEWVLNTPSHHRVHHGINPEYIDRNHAGMLITWDRLYGTFALEREEPVYGTVAVLDSFDPIWANFQYWSYLAGIARSTPRWADKLWVWFAPPEWTPEGAKPILEVHVESFDKWDVPLAPGLAPYVLIQFAVFATAGTVWLLFMEGETTWGWLGLLGVSVLWGTWSWGQLFHRRAVGVYSELARLALAPVVVGILLLESPWLVPLTATFAVVALGSAAWLVARRADWTTAPPVRAAAAVAK
jgi:sterol desaturase/sphingolipid hydroxylase (fatty acid hydroxylase superfamily)